ncbi:hypothetical protein Tco_0500037 [Tanacetum coccineum]
MSFMITRSAASDSFIWDVEKRYRGIKKTLSLLLCMFILSSHRPLCSNVCLAYGNKDKLTEKQRRGLLDASVPFFDIQDKEDGDLCNAFELLDQLGYTTLLVFPDMNTCNLPVQPYNANEYIYVKLEKDPRIAQVDLFEYKQPPTPLSGMSKRGTEASRRPCLCFSVCLSLSSLGLYAQSCLAYGKKDKLTEKQRQGLLDASVPFFDIQDKESRLSYHEKSMFALLLLQIAFPICFYQGR